MAYVHWKKELDGRLEITPDHLLYCTKCLTNPATRPKAGTADGTPLSGIQPTTTRARKPHKLNCSCGVQFRTLVAWERHELERSWEAKMEDHYPQCEGCGQKVFKLYHRFLDTFGILLKQEKRQADEKHQSAIEEARAAAADVEADPSFTTQFYSSTAADPPSAESVYWGLDVFNAILDDHHRELRDGGIEDWFRGSMAQDDERVAVQNSQKRKLSSTCEEDLDDGSDGDFGFGRGSSAKRVKGGETVDSEEDSDMMDM